VEALLFRDAGRNQAARRAAIDYAYVHHELHKSALSVPRNAVRVRAQRAREGRGFQRRNGESPSDFCLGASVDRPSHLLATR